tara:strand:- start:1914 stop:2144 length:231 start_codon:yes stop_codon:yes gene_type:complete
MEQKLKEIMSVVFNEPIENINSSSSPASVSKWDSLAQLNLIIAIEETFKIKLNDSEIENIKNFDSILKILQKKYNS